MQKHVTITLSFNEQGQPLMPALDRAYVRLSVGGATPVKPPPDQEDEPIAGVYIEGNATGLRALAHIILGVAESTNEDYHEHLDNEANAPFYSSRDGWWLTIERTVERKKRSR